MNKNQSAQLNMCKTVVVVLTSTTNTPIVATIPALVQYKDDLIALIAEIQDLAEIQEGADDGVTEDKEVKRLRLCRDASIMAGLLMSWAINTGNTLIAGQMKITYSDLTRTKESLLAERCRFIHTVGTDNQVAAALYGVTVAKLNALDTRITSYEGKATAPRDAEIIIKAATIDLEKKLGDAMDLLDDRMDPLVNSFIDDEPTFYNQYYAARVIVDAGTQHTKSEGIVKNAVTNAVLANVKVKATQILPPESTDEPAIFLATTDADGKYTMLMPVNGIYNFLFEKEVFNSKTIENITITLGETTDLDASLDPLAP